MKKMMNVKNFQLPQSKNSSNEKNCIKSIDIIIPELSLTPKKPNQIINSKTPLIQQINLQVKI